MEGHCRGYTQLLNVQTKEVYATLCLQALPLAATPTLRTRTHSSGWISEARVHSGVYMTVYPPRIVYGTKPTIYRSKTPYV